ncbi:MAG: tripartite tricarboxylate transporter permease [Nanoarchaeota archaeon]|nr:tripartite tricarboxylate transporter permease [Nanoarchaeota archaeon]
MIIEIVAAIILGCFFGIITGLIPGIHVNLVSILLISVSPALLVYTSPIVLAVFIISLALTHTFLDSIPSIFLGAPDPDMVLSVLPGHKMLLEGKGYEAVKLTVIGSFFCLLVTLMLIPILVPFLPLIYSSIQPYMGYILLAVVIAMILMEKGVKKKFIGMYIFFQAGMLGLLVINMPNLKQPLFPMLSGLFGISTLLLSLGEKVIIPKQEITSTVKVGKVKTLKAIIAGVFSGSLTGLFPGLGAAQASIIGMVLVGRSIGMHAFLILVGGINTVNFAFSMATFYALEKARNGAIVAVMDMTSKISYPELMIFILSALVAGCVAAFLALSIGKVFSKLISKVNYRFLVFGVISLISVLVFLLTGVMGFLVLIVSIFIGMMPALLNVKRSHNMGCLLLPVILYFLV